MKDKKCET